MRVVRTKARTDSSGIAHVRVSTAMPDESVELVLVINRISKSQTRKTPKRFADLVGRLRWAGDALEEQRRLRDEW